MSPEPSSRGPLPFLAALEPWVADGRAWLDRRQRTATPPTVTPSLRADFEHWLARDLVDAASAALLDGFLDHPGRSSMSPRSRADYDRYVAHLASTAMASVFRRCPELAPVLESVTAAWSARVDALLTALQRDRHLVGPILRGPVQHAVPVGETVVVLRAGDRTVVYKSRPVDMDVAFARLLDVVNGWQPPYRLVVPWTVDRGAYGWMQHIPHHAPRGWRADPAYWHRVGMLLCLVHAVGGGDIHAGNVRVDGSHPVIIDAEVMLRPRRATVDDTDPDVISTGFLPTWAEAERCGLAAVAHDRRPARWVHPGTDAMRRRTMRSPLRAVRAEVLGGFATLISDGRLAALLDGFETTYRLILDHGVPLQVFNGCRPRVLLRTSHLYQDAIEQSLAPEHLVSTHQREHVLRRLTHQSPPVLADVPLATAEAASVAEAVAAEEFRAMAAGCVPRFRVAVDGRDLWSGSRCLGPVFARSPRDRTATFVDRLSLSACADQVDRITAALAAASADQLVGPARWRLRFVPASTLVRGTPAHPEAIGSAH